MEKVVALIVTYNRKNLLSECIDALRNQTRRPDSILVINNGSTDETEQWLTKQKDVEFISQNNIGSAGGFSTGITHAFKQGFTWVWCMDDDGYPKNDALENILKYDNGDLKLLNCAVLDKENKNSFVWATKNYKTIKDVNEKCIEGVGHPFNGTLLHRKIIERVGVPSAKFFLWGDETEYLHRIVKKNKIPVFTITDSIHYHPSTRFSIKQEWDYATNWKMYFYVRNRYAVLKAKLDFKPFAVVHYACFLVAFAAVILVFQKTGKVKKLQAMLQPSLHAFKNNYDATPASVLKELAILRSQKLVTFSLSKSLQKLFTRSVNKYPTVINQNSSAA